MFEPAPDPTSHPLTGPDAPKSNTFCFAINCKNVPPIVWDYVHASLAENTRRAYLSDLAHFEAWGGKIPATEGMLASYLAAHAGRLNTSTLSRRLSAISKAHSGYPTNSASSALVRATMRGIRRRHRRPARQAKPLSRDELFAVLDATGNELRDVRDRALLLIGFAGAFRRSELVGLDREDVEFCDQGILLHVRHSKTDQCGVGRQVAIQYGTQHWCPVSALREWLDRSQLQHGPMFVHVDRHDRLLGRLSGEAVSLMVRERVAAAGLCPTKYSGHSLRAGFATSAAQSGLSAWGIRHQTGHKSLSTLAGYVRPQQLFAQSRSVL